MENEFFKRKKWIKSSLGDRKSLGSQWDRFMKDWKQIPQDNGVHMLKKKKCSVKDARYA